MTKREYIASYLCETVLGLHDVDANLREISKTLVNIANELERMSPIELDATEPHTEPQKATKDDGGSLVPSPVPLPQMPPQGSVNPLEAIRAMTQR